MPWKKLYESCVSETNPDKLKKLVSKLEEAIVLRYHDLARTPNGSNNFKESDELQAIRRIALQLRQLKMEKLMWLQPATAAAAAIPISIPISEPAVMLPLALPAVDVVKEAVPLKTARRTFASRIQSALRITQRAWENWVFKSLK